MGDGTIQCTVSGLGELGQQLGENSVQVIRRVLRRTEKEVGKVWIDAISARAPVSEEAGPRGHLRDNITFKTTATPDGMTLEVGPDKAHWYALFPEFGTRYQAAQPFIRPAFEETQSEALETFARILEQELETLEKQKAAVLDVIQEQIFGK